MRVGMLGNLIHPLFVSLFFAVLTAGGIAHSKSESVSIEASRSLYSVGEKVEFTVTNSGAASIFLPGCGALQVQRFESETYIPVPWETCVSEGVAVEVPPGSHVLSYAPDSGTAGLILRAGASYGMGCESGRELSQARCAKFKTVYSASFRIGRGK